MSGYFARVAAQALGGATALRPAAATRYGAHASVAAAAEPAREAAPVPRDAHARASERAVEIEPVRVGTVRPFAREAPLVEPARERADGERDPAPAVVRTPAAHVARDADPLDAGGEPAPRAHIPALANDADSAAAAQRLLPLGDAAPLETAPGAARSVSRQHGVTAPLEAGRAQRRASSAARAGAADERDAADVYVHIGRIDVRAVAAPERRPAAAARTELRMPSLEAHLRARDGGRA